MAKMSELELTKKQLKCFGNFLSPEKKDDGYVFLPNGMQATVIVTPREKFFRKTQLDIEANIKIEFENTDKAWAVVRLIASLVREIQSGKNS